MSEWYKDGDIWRKDEENWHASVYQHVGGEGGRGYMADIVTNHNSDLESSGTEIGAAFDGNWDMTADEAKAAAEAIAARELLKSSPGFEERLKKLCYDWLQDPCWDIESTKGFEPVRDELLEFRKQAEARWAAENQTRLLKKAEELGCPGNIKLAEAFERLERKLDEAQERIEDLQAHCDKSFSSLNTETKSLKRGVYLALNPNP